MESNFFSGSENLYKYLVSVGALMMILSVYYPLNETQQLEIVKINLNSDVKSLDYDIKENQKKIDKFKKELSSAVILPEKKRELLDNIKVSHKANMLKQIKSEAKVEEIDKRETYISLYKWIFYICFPLGFIISAWGFWKWRKAKKDEDAKCMLERELLQIQVDIAKRDASTNSQP
jgi:regulator of replication initiation timing